jgi:hypothetical protein
VKPRRDRKSSWTGAYLKKARKARTAATPAPAAHFLFHDVAIALLLDRPDPMKKVNRERRMIRTRDVEPNPGRASNIRAEVTPRKKRFAVLDLPMTLAPAAMRMARTQNDRLL